MSNGSSVVGIVSSGHDRDTESVSSSVVKFRFVSLLVGELWEKWTDLHNSLKNKLMPACHHRDR